MCCVRTRQHPLPVWSYNLSLTNLLISPSILNHFRWELYQLRSMEIKVPLPIKVQVDNVGAISLANNSSVSERTKHVDLRAHFVRDMIKDQVIEINFVKSAENDSDIMTKNQQGQHYMYAKSKLVYTVQEMNDERDIQDEETGRMLES